MKGRFGSRRPGADERRVRKAILWFVEPIVELILEPPEFLLEVPGSGRGRQWIGTAWIDAARRDDREAGPDADRGDRIVERHRPERGHVTVLVGDRTERARRPERQLPDLVSGILEQR